MTCKKLICIIFAFALCLQLASCAVNEIPSGKSNTESADASNGNDSTDSGIKIYTKPTSSDTAFTYSGAEIRFMPNGYKSDAMDISGNTSTECGEYTAVISLKDKQNTSWDDGTTDDISIKWSITREATDYKLEQTDDNKLNVISIDSGITYNADIVYPIGATYQMSQGGRLTFFYDTESEEEITFELSGEFCGSLAFEITDETDTVIELDGFSIISYNDCPIYIANADNVDILAKKDTVNTITDKRNATEELKAAIYSVCDLKLKGAGKLNIISENNNGIHSKDDLNVQKLTLYVSCVDNALKGNDGVKIKSGDITLVSTDGDGIKTSNSSVSSKGNQKGDIVIEDGKIDIYAACDGIDAAHDVVVENGTLNIFTDKYSNYSGDSDDSNGASTLSAISESAVRLLFGGPGGGGNPGMGGGGPGGGGNPGMGGGGRPGIGGGMNDGNTDKGDHSTKGIKAANEINISGGDITIKAYDDAIHANADEALENGIQPTGNITISGGTITLSSNDDAIHADGKALISGGDVNILTSYEGIEGNFVEISGGNVSVIATDDGLNGTSAAGESIIVSGGTLYVYAGGDGLDSNSMSSYDGILFSGGNSVIISTGRGDSAIDTERGYKYTGGKVVAIGALGGMTSETVNCQNFNSVGSRANDNLTDGSCLTVADFVAVKMPCALSATVVVLGKPNAKFTSTSQTSETLDANGICWLD